MPQYAKDFEICSIEDEETLVDFETIHRELTDMLEDVKACLDKHQISFMLDGGTLIGACRSTNNHSFLQWDDDIDIAIKSCDTKRIKEIIAEELGEKYTIQNYGNEDAYSPRLATFRIRQKNSHSMVCEKDSELFELYATRGLFIDVYAYCPILVCKWVDVLYRRLLIHPINKRIRKVEADWKFGHDSEKALAKFRRMKKEYVKRGNWYIRHAKNEKYVSYEPFYVYNLNESGPYIKAEDMYGKKRMSVFEGREYEIPSNSEAVLTAYYGKEWEKSPFVSLEDLVENGELSYSKATFDASNYKHLKKVSLYNK